MRQRGGEEGRQEELGEGGGGKREGIEKTKHYMSLLRDRNILCVFTFVKYHSKNVISEKAARKLTKLKRWLFDSS